MRGSVLRPRPRNARVTQDRHCRRNPRLFGPDAPSVSKFGPSRFLPRWKALRERCRRRDASTRSCVTSRRNSDRSDRQAGRDQLLGNRRLRLVEVARAGRFDFPSLIFEKMNEGALGVRNVSNARALSGQAQISPLDKRLALRAGRPRQSCDEGGRMLPPN